jgi:hypothetical protein
MPPYDYSEDVQFARESIEEYGRDIRFYAASETVDPANPLGSPAAPANSDTVKAVFVYPTGLTNLGFTASVRELFKTCEQIALIGSHDTINYEAQTHVVDFDNSVWKIVRIEKFQPGAVPLLYYIGVTR